MKNNFADKLIDFVYVEDEEESDKKEDYVYNGSFIDWDRELSDLKDYKKYLNNCLKRDTVYTAISAVLALYFSARYAKELGTNGLEPFSSCITFTLLASGLGSFGLSLYFDHEDMMKYIDVDDRIHVLSKSRIKKKTS